MAKQIELVKELIAICNPVKLLARCNKIAAQEFVDFGDDASTAIRREVGLLRAGEYVQAVLVSIENRFSPIERECVQEQNISEAINAIKSLYDLAIWTSFFADKIIPQANLIFGTGRSYAFQRALGMLNVRGRREPYMQRQYHELLLKPHDEIFHTIYGIGTDDIIDGFLKLQWSLRDGIRIRYQDTSNESILNGEFRRLDLSPSSEMIQDLFDVANITAWPDVLMKDLSYSLNEGTGFYSGNFPGWTFQVSVIRKKPLIEINGRYYVFNHYLLADNFYRALQYSIRQRLRIYDWRKKQCSASEQEAYRVFSSLLPDAQIFLNNHFPKGNSFATKGESDLIIQYRDVLIVVEVKGGHIDNLSVVERGEEFDKTFNSIDTAISQCEEIEHYLKSASRPVLYNEDWTVKAVLNLDGTAQIIKIVLTVDGVNEFAACTDALNGLVRNSAGVICLSLDDLHLYERYFSSLPLLYLCFLSERVAATYVPAIQVYDELDHLAAFIGNPCYARTAQRLTNKFNFINQGSVEELESYLSAPLNPQKSIQKPLPYCSRIVVEIFDALSKTRHPNSLEIAQFFLEIGKEGQQELETFLRSEIVRQQMGERPSCVCMVTPDGTGLLICISARGLPLGLDKKYIRQRMLQNGISRWRAFGLISHGKIDEICYIKENV